MSHLVSRLNDAHLPRGSLEPCAGRALDSLHDAVRLPLEYSRTSKEFSALLLHLMLTPQEEAVGARTPHPPSFPEAEAAEQLLLGQGPFPSLHYVLFILEPNSEAGKPESHSWGHARGLLSPVTPLAPLPYSQKAVSPKHIDPGTSCLPPNTTQPTSFQGVLDWQHCAATRCLQHPAPSRLSKHSLACRMLKLNVS